MTTFNFDLQLFASAPAAKLGTFGMGKESTFGTAVTPTVFHIPSTWGADIENNLIDRPGATGSIGEREKLTGLVMGAGSLMAELDPDTAGSIFLAVLGAEAIGANASNPGAAPTVSTTLSTAITVTGYQPATPAAMTNITVGQRLIVDTAGNQETVYVDAVSSTQFWAKFTKAHASAVTITQATQIAAQDHTFTLASPSLSFTAQVNDVVAAKNAFGCQADSLSMKLQPKTVVEATMGFQYQSELTNGSPTAASFSTLRGLVFETPGNTVTLNGIALDSSIQGIDLQIQRNIQKDYPKMGNGRLRPQLPDMGVKVSGTLNLAYETQTALQMLWGNVGATGPQSKVVAAPLVLTIKGIDYVNTGVAYAIQIKIPMAKFAKAPIVRKVGDYLKQTVSFVASESATGAGDDISVVVTNGSSAASL